MKTLAQLVIASVAVAIIATVLSTKVEQRSGALIAAAQRTLTPPWPRATDQAVSVSKDLMARNYYVVLDASGSMKNQACSGSQSKLETAKRALAAFAQSLPADANLGLQVFDSSGVREWLPLGTGNRAEFSRQVNRAQADGGTPLYNSVSQAYEKLVAQGKRQLGYGEYYLVVVTDGEADSGQDPGPVVQTILTESPVLLHTIGFCIGANHSLNQAGRTIYKAADNPEALRSGLADVLAEAPVFTPTAFK